MCQGSLFTRALWLEIAMVTVLQQEDTYGASDLWAIGPVDCLPYYLTIASTGPALYNRYQCSCGAKEGFRTRLRVQRVCQEKRSCFSSKHTSILSGNTVLQSKNTT